MVIAGNSIAHLIILNRLRSDYFTQFSTILKVIGEIFMLTNVESAMTVRDVAAFLNVDEKTIYRLITKGELPGFKVLGSWRFQRRDLEAWIESKKQKPKSQMPSSSIASQLT